MFSGVLLSPSIEINKVPPQVTEEVENVEILEEIQTIAEENNDASMEAAEDIKNNFLAQLPQSLD